MNKAILKVGGMSCSHCERRVGQALRSVPGIVDAKVSARDGTAEISFEGAMPSLEVLRGVIEDAGYRLDNP